MDLSFFMELSGVQIAYLLVVVFLFFLAIIDLWVGVSNDAVNFIGSAVGYAAQGANGPSTAEYRQFAYGFRLLESCTGEP